MAAWQELNAASDGDARQFLTRCCGSRVWVERMLARRPFTSDDQLIVIARHEWFGLAPADWREAFRHHPKIGDREAPRGRFPDTAHLSAEEQRGLQGTPDEVLGALADGNRAYEQKFGYIFIVCATGRTASEMLALLRDRLPNTPEVELRIAAEEQARITAIRLRKGAAASR
jgi:2-oxo-4-hydroxy-4-carboxy-5-ureidoimidazoline decarboxylase